MSTPSPAAAAARLEPTLQQVSITFFTVDQNKDHDTHVRITVYDRNNRTIALADGTYGEFRERTYSPRIELEVTREIPLSQLRGGRARVRIEITPNGNDTWTFNFRAPFLFTEGASAEVYQRERVAVSEDYRTWETPIT
ncbi:hypothetical protein [Streptomyces sp. RK9]|uniref:hypothetical protein n=1 Tax=Streptomyces sp. RK9 TaxID=3239284 RepID=UPI0038652048